LSPTHHISFFLPVFPALGGTADADATRELMSKAFSLGINMFDTAEVYSSGNAEVVMGKAVRDLKWDRSEVVLVTKSEYE